MRQSTTAWRLVVMVCAAAILPGEAAAVEDFDVRACDGLRKIPRYPDDEIWQRLPSRLSLALVRGESESGQVALRAAQALRLTGLRAEPPTLRHQATGEALPASPEPLYMVAYINPLEPDPEDSMWPAVPGALDQPDPLRPVPDRLTLEPGETLTVWLTVTAPRDAPAGRYRGDLRLGWRGLEEPLLVPVEVEVWDVSLPANTRVQTQLFGLNLGEVARYAGLDQDRRNPRWRQIIRRCVDLHRHYRISPYAGALWGVGSSPSVCTGRFGGGWRFDGHVTSATLELPEALVGSREFTVMSWGRPRSGDERTQFVLSCWGRGEGLRLEYREGASIGLYARRKEPETWTGQLEAPLAADEWHHVAVAASPHVTRLFVDGVEQGGLQEAPVGLISSRLVLGTYPYMNSSLYSGDLDEVRCFARALDAAAIQREMQAPAERSDAIVDEAMDARPAGGVSPYTDRGAELLTAWWRLWRSEGLHIGNVTAPGAYKWNRMDFRTAEAFFSRYYPWLEREGALEYCYTRMPVDESVTGRGREVNLSYAKWLGEHYPGINRHHTIGDHIEDEQFDNVMAFAGHLDIWDFTPGVWHHRGHRTVEALEARRQQHGERFAWYMTRSSPVLRGGTPLKPLDLRGFFWQMMKHGVSMPSHWCVNLWDRQSGKHADRDLRWFEEQRCYRFRPSTAAGVASATFLWPTESGPVPSIRWAAIRDGIEDFDLWWLVKEGARSARDGGVSIPGLEGELAWIDEAPLRLVGLLGFSTQFGGAAQFREHRGRLARAAVRLNRAGLLPPPGDLCAAPPQMPWRLRLGPGP
ncbi:MAG: LamG domain-containing protein [Armatimonadota bacterium]|nr:LamG domain-containing protein [Armatimonadota bacterium]